MRCCHVAKQRNQIRWHRQGPACGYFKFLNSLVLHSEKRRSASFEKTEHVTANAVLAARLLGSRHELLEFLAARTFEEFQGCVRGNYSPLFAHTRRFAQQSPETCCDAGQLGGSLLDSLAGPALAFVVSLLL